jgi:hypothetical protein
VSQLTLDSLTVHILHSQQHHHVLMHDIFEEHDININIDYGQAFGE